MWPTRQQLYACLEQADSNSMARWFDYSLTGLILFNVLAVVLASEANIYQRFSTAFDYFELFSISIFTVEYILRVWLIPQSPQKKYHHPLRGRLRYLLTPMALIDLLAILPFYLGTLLGIGDFRILLSLRLLRLFKLTRHSQAMTLLIRVIQQEAAALSSAILVLCLLILLAAAGMYLVESQQQPEEFGSILRALWWSTVSLATIGYGDVVPLTTLGKLLAGFIIIIGVAIAALPTAILASGFMNELMHRRNLFRMEVIQALEQDSLKFSDLRHLEHLRLSIGVSHADARLIFEEVKQSAWLQTHLNCPHCHQALVIRHPAGQIHLAAHKPTMNTNTH